MKLESKLLTFLEVTNLKGRKVRTLQMPQGDYISIVYPAEKTDIDLKIDYFHKKEFKWECNFDIPEEWLTIGIWTIL